MIDSHLRAYYDSIFTKRLVATKLFQKIHPHFLTLCAGLSGLLTCYFLYLELKYAAFATLVFSGLLDTLDGSAARSRNLASHQGAVFDIVSDRIVEFAIVLGLYTVQPVERAFYVILMQGSILICVTTFLVVGLFTKNTSEKGFHYSPGMMERTEAFICFSIMILWPKGFILVSLVFTSLVFLTAFHRISRFLTSIKQCGT